MDSKKIIERIARHKLTVFYRFSWNTFIFCDLSKIINDKQFNKINLLP